MATTPVHFIGTGRPISPQINPRLNRDASRSGVLKSGVRTVREFQQMIQTNLQIQPRQLGQNASDIARSFQSGVDYTI